MLGMTEFYLPDQALTPYQALRTYTVNPASPAKVISSEGRVAISQQTRRSNRSCSSTMLSLIHI